MTEYFKPLEKSDMSFLEPYRYSNYVGDTTFSMLYAWGEKADYRYHLYDGLMALSGIIDGRNAFVLMRRHPGISLDLVFHELDAYCSEQNISLIFEDVREEEFDEYRSASYNIGKKAIISFDDKYSDYLYETSEMISMDGGRNKTKRGSYNYIQSHFPDIRYEAYKAELFDDCMKIFDSWCETHECEPCLHNYGCERNAFRRFMEVYREDRHRIGIVYHGTCPLAFAVCEQISDDTVSFYFQKNAKRIRGLTYWLGREMALQYQDIKYINLGEDMGIPGLIADKTGFHPCTKLKKYTVAVI